MREYKRKSDLATQSQEIYDIAATEVLENNCRIRKASKNFDRFGRRIMIFQKLTMPSLYSQQKKNIECLHIFLGAPKYILDNFLWK